MPAQDPWRKAYTLSRARTPADAQPGTRTGRVPPHLRARRPVWPWLTLLLVLVGAGGWWAWRERAVLVPKYADELPAPAARVARQIPMPPPELDVALFDAGLGVGLYIGADYLNLIGATRGWDVAWKLTELGGGNLRAAAPGLTVYIRDGRIRGYRLDVAEVFAAPEWEPWRAQLNKAGLHAEVSWASVTGETAVPTGVTEHTLVGRGGQEWAGESAASAYTLYFRDGWLTRIEGGLRSGLKLPDAVFNPPPEEAAEPPQPVERESLDNPLAPPPPAG